MAAYPNTIGVISANEVINDRPSTVAAEVIRAVVRDIKRYQRLKHDFTGQRILPVGISSSDVAMYRKTQLQYFTAGDREEAVDFYCFSCYSWSGVSSMRVSGYEWLVETLSDAQVPVFFSEYGTNITRPRLFQETRAILSPEMTHVFSGGCAYEFYQHVNQYGLVIADDDGLMLRMPDFENLRISMKESTVAPRTDEEWASDRLTAARQPQFPSKDSNWLAMPVIPPSPLDWSVVALQVDFEKEWVVVNEEETDASNS